MLTAEDIGKRLKKAEADGMIGDMEVAKKVENIVNFSNKNINLAFKAWLHP